jgi:hypothetical protein
MATRQKIGFPEGGGDVNVTNWLKGVLKRSRVGTKRTMSVAHHPTDPLIYRLDKRSIRFASSRETPAEDAARVHALNLR